MKLALCMPCRDQVSAGFSFDLARLAAHFGAFEVPKGGSLHVFHNKGTLIASQRERLAEEAIMAGCSHILWLDTDMRFPKDVYKRLAAHDKDIVACNYATRRLPVETVAFDVIGPTKDRKWECVYTTDADKGLRKVAAVGMGVMLMKTSVFKKLPKPWFLIGYSQAVNDYTGEDVYFCKNAAHAGFDVWIDQDASKDVAHVGEFEFRHDHANVCVEEAADGNNDVQ